MVEVGVLSVLPSTFIGTLEHSTGMVLSLCIRRGWAREPIEILRPCDASDFSASDSHGRGLDRQGRDACGSEKGGSAHRQ